MERPFRSVAPRRPRWNTRRCRWTMRIVCPRWERSSRYVDNVEKLLSQGVAFGIRHERCAAEKPWTSRRFMGFPESQQSWTTYNTSGACIAAKADLLCQLMGWAGRAPAPPAREAGKGRQTRGARHVSQGQFSNSRDRHRYRQELISRGWSGQARRDHASAEVVARTGGSTAGQLAALSNRHGGLRRCASSESQAANAWTRRSAYAGEVRAPVFEGTEERFPRCGGHR